MIRFLDGPDRGGGWKEFIALFEEAHPDIDVELIEGPAATDTREDMYATSFLSGESTYDMVYLDVIWTSKFAAAGWLIPLMIDLRKSSRSSFYQAAWQPRDIAARYIKCQCVPVQACFTIVKISCRNHRRPGPNL